MVVILLSTEVLREARQALTCLWSTERGAGSRPPGACSPKSGVALHRMRPSLIRVAVAVAGVSLLAAGGTAVFVTDNGPGSAAMVTLGAALVVAAGMWDRLETFEFAGAKMQMRIVERLRDRAVEAEARGDTAAADALRAEARALLEEARPVATSYEQLRESLSPGAERTAKLEELVVEARAATQRKAWEPLEVRQLFESGTDGNRIYALALMEADERLRDFETAMEAVEHSRSAFEQWHALYLALLMLPTLADEQRRQLESLLTDRPANAAHIKPGTDRWTITQQILGQLNENPA
jgi:hypothetical protein